MYTFGTQSRLRKDRSWQSACDYSHAERNTRKSYNPWFGYGRIPLYGKGTHAQQTPPEPHRQPPPNRC